MGGTWYYAVAERDRDIQNPTSPDKIRHLGAVLRLGPSSRVLDVASGRGGPALILARTYGCQVTAVERSQAFLDAARERAATGGMEDLIEFVHADALTIAFERVAYDAALCLGASFIWSGLGATLDALAPAVRPGGYVAVGEPYWRRWPLPAGYRPDDPPGTFATLEDTVARFEERGLPVISLIAASADDWDRYLTLRWQAVEEWLAANPRHPDAEEIREHHRHDREDYLRRERDLLGWAIFAGWKAPQP